MHLRDGDRNGGEQEPEEQERAVDVIVGQAPDQQRQAANGHRGDVRAQRPTRMAKGSPRVRVRRNADRAGRGTHRDACSRAPVPLTG